MVQFIRSIPRELDQAAMMDGANPLQIYWKIILPLMKPALITTTIFTFIWTYDDFLHQLVYLQQNDKFTVPLGLTLFMDQTSGSSSARCSPCRRSPSCRHSSASSSSRSDWWKACRPRA
ncbi:ABC transporter permease subunit [Streptomyces thinghirensis]|nr:ABC transporter permease subunit [Streptomyces thinghirensis]